MKLKKYYVEGYGCALNISETEKISGFLESQKFEQADDFKEADIVVINTCAVKAVTEQRMLSRISFLFENKRSGAKLFVFGCLSAARSAPIKKISEKMTVLDTNLESLCRALKIRPKKFSPEMKSVKTREMISIIPIATGCVGGCSYCITKIARGELHSYSEKEIEVAFKKATAESKEIWITSQDLGCYGVDSSSSLPKLLKRLLKNEGDYFVRLGMMNPNHFKKIHKQLMPLFENRRLYKFLHLPVQSGSDQILKAMGRKYSGKDFLDCLKIARASQPNITISTDVIVGFPGEAKADFEKTLALLGKAKPDVVNISRFGKRPGTKAAIMKNQLSESEKKERSRKISSFCKNLFLEKNKKLVGKKFDALVSEKAGNGFFTARTDCYRPVLVKSCFGKFARVRITKAYPNFFEGEIVSCQK